jgi:predicted metal-dependent phosphoesterase TrpH
VPKVARRRLGSERPRSRFRPALSFTLSSAAAMTRLYRAADSSRADAIQEALEAMVIRHEVVVAPDAADLPSNVAPSDLPVLVDEGSVFTTPDAIEERLRRLRELMNDWDQFQSDACYIEDDGTIC